MPLLCFSDLSGKSRICHLLGDSPVLTLCTRLPAGVGDIIESSPSDPQLLKGLIAICRKPEIEKPSVKHNFRSDNDDDDDDVELTADSLDVTFTSLGIVGLGRVLDTRGLATNNLYQVWIQNK